MFFDCATYVKNFMVSWNN